MTFEEMLSRIPDEIKLEVEKSLGCRLTGFEPSSGGCINQGGELTTSLGNFFLKWNSARKYPSMFEQEAKGLTLLSKHCSIRIPKVLVTGSLSEFQYILMEYIRPGKATRDYSKQLGEHLSELHKNTGENFGLDHDNYIGALPQRNKWHQSWLEFFIEERLQPQIVLASTVRCLTVKILKAFETLFDKLGEILPIATPSLVHGDLWGGNVIIDEKGGPCLIDPAVHYGNREAELAFTRLFGGFSGEFYDAYEKNFPLEEDFENRIDLYNLYPLLVHLNLFGERYLPQVVSILRRYV